MSAASPRNYISNDDTEDDATTMDPDSDSGISSSSAEQSDSEYEASEGLADDNSNDDSDGDMNYEPNPRSSTESSTTGSQASSIQRPRHSHTLRSSTASTRVSASTASSTSDVYIIESDSSDDDNPPVPPHPMRPSHPPGRLFPTRFHQSPLPYRTPPFKDLIKLEFYQVFPHDPASTLCLHHFLCLARAWFSRRRGDPEREIAELVWQFPHSRVDHQLRYMRSDVVMAGIRQYDEWRQVPLEDLIEDLKVEILTVEQRMRIFRRNMIRRHGRAPSCCLNNGKALVCGYCVALRYPKHNLYDKIEELARGYAHGKIREDEEDLLIGRGRVLPTEDELLLDASDAYGSVGGLHFLVDSCDDHIMIKFASTRVSQPEKQYLWEDGRGSLDKHMFDEPRAFNLVVCSAGDGQCACQVGRDVGTLK